MHRDLRSTLARTAVSALLATGCGGDNGGTGPEPSETIDLQPTIFATGEDAGPQDGEFDQFRLAPNLGMVNNNGFVSHRTALEYSVSAIPRTATVTSATLRLPLLIFEGQRSIQVHAYAADGAATLSDFARNQVLATYTVTGHQNFVVDATEFVNSVRGSNGVFAGFNIREAPANTPNFTIMRVRDDPPPVLRIEFRPRP